MMTGRQRCGGERSRASVSFVMTALCCLLLAVFLLSCGRRGDPVALSPYEGGEAEQSGVIEHEKGEPAAGAETAAAPQPLPPTGVTALFAGDKVIVVWNEVSGAGVTRYRVYRSEGSDFRLIAEVHTPVFNDSTVVQGMKYSYRISAVGQSESGLSEAVSIVAGGD